MSQGQQANRKKAYSRGAIVGGIAVVVLLAATAVTVLSRSDSAGSSQARDEARTAALASEASPSLGPRDAKVHIVEFLDPACETCALFYPMVKGWLAEAPDELRLSVRHVAFHEGSDYAVRILEASRNQDKYWETLDALLTSQRQWVQNHSVLQDRILPVVQRAGLDTNRLLADMNSDEVLGRVQRDHDDAVTMKVSATPEYFVNGRPLPSFGQEQLRELVLEELMR